jgi:hypothetical protein
MKGDATNEPTYLFATIGSLVEKRRISTSRSSPLLSGRHWRGSVFYRHSGRRAYQGHRDTHRKLSKIDPQAADEYTVH